jgi:SAM-dependent methyltransferase
LNFSSKTSWTGEIKKERGYLADGRRLGKQFIRDAVDLSSLKQKSYDFVASSNNIEHIANPMKAVLEWLSVLKTGGVLLIIAPRKESNFDHKRKIVTFSHLLEDFENDIQEDDLSHMREILQFHDRELAPVGTYKQLRKRSLNNYRNRCLHQHVFDLAVLQEIFEYFGLSVFYAVQLPTNYVILGRKTTATELLEAVFKSTKLPGSIPQLRVVTSQSITRKKPVLSVKK